MFGVDAQGSHLLYRLVSRAIFAQTDGVVGVDHHLTLFHQRRHAYRVTRVFHEHQEGRGVRQEAAVQRDTVGNRGHTEFAYAVVDVVTGSVFVDRLSAGPQGQVGRRQVGGAAEEFRQQRAEALQWRSAMLCGWRSSPDSPVA